MSKQCQLLETSSIEVYYSEHGGYHLIVADCKVLSPTMEASIVETPITVFPPELRIEGCGESDGKAPQSRIIDLMLMIPEKQKEFVVYSKDKRWVVPVQEAPLFTEESLVGDTKKGIEVVGTSNNMSFDEAYADALRKLYAQIDIADAPLDTVVKNVRTTNIGIAGINILHVEVTGYTINT